MSESLTVDGLTVWLPSAARPVVADVSFTLAPGECLGVVGESGSGKSITARAVLGIPPAGMSARGTVGFGSRTLDVTDAETMRRWRSDHVGVIFQDPASVMDPTRTVGDYLTEVLVYERRMRRADALQKAAETLTSMGLTDTRALLDRYPHEFSGGQLQRICIAAALLPDPDLLIADEPTTALDSTTQALVIALLDRARRERKLSTVFITHNLELALAFCDRIAVAYAGRIVEIGDTRTVARGGYHPYTNALLRCQPDVERRRDALPVIEGQPPTLDQPLTGCVFRERCPQAVDDCAEPPAWTAGDERLGYACIRPMTPGIGPNGAHDAA
jgi:peptide/nickel transport system ATP-binding protein